MRARSVGIALLIVACGVEPKKPRGAQCELNSECDTPLVCRIDHCRVECATARDCAAGLACLLDDRGFGSCQLPEELSCNLTSDCTPPLVCAQRQCVNECATDVDCPAGATCMEGGCIDPSTSPCIMHAECRAIDPTFVCAHDQRCRVECANDRECRYGTTCIGGACMPIETVRDGGIADGAMTDGAAVDGAPTRDAGRACGTMPPVDIEVGAEFSCGIFTAGAARTVWCWGHNWNGRLGVPEEGLVTADPVRVEGIDDALMLALGDSHACVLRSDGTVWCWGRNFNGELGDGTTTSRSTPMPVTGITDAVWVAAGWQNTCVAHATGAVSCWGQTNNGASGDGTITMGTRTTPIPILPAGRTIPARDPVTLGNLTGCAVDASSAVCWGQGTEGQLADGTTSIRTSPSPSLVPVPSDALDLGAHGCSVSAGDVWCWGQNTFGQLGDGTTVTSYVPVRATGLAGATVVRVGNTRACAMDAGGDLWCWGRNSTGRLGDGTTIDRHVPTRLTSLSGVTDVAVAGNHMCAVAAGEVWCWGRNGQRELGDPTVIESTTPIRVACPP